jgi:murein tripeptide amidase MpaA
VSRETAIVPRVIVPTRLFLALVLTASTAAAARPSAPPAPQAVVPAEPVSTAPAMPDTLVPIFWKTRAERSEYRTTADYEETIRFCRQLEAGSRWIQYQSYGKSAQGRDLPLLVVSTDRAFTPQAARATGKPIVLIQNGIHSGEIEGKDASLALLRDLAVLRKRTDLLDHVILLVLPIFSVDAHERHSRYNRINQNGPEEMGFRTTATGLNLNRDYVKVETPEMRALIGNVFTKWWPHLLVDDHTTDGADYRFDVSYGIQHGAGVPPAIDRWLAESFEGRVVPRLEALGHRVSPYLDFRQGKHPESGIVFGNSSPRFSHAYAVLQNRPAILVETHSLKPYRQRVIATYDLLIALLEELRARPAALTTAVQQTEAATVARAGAVDAGRDVVLGTDTTSTTVPFPFEGWSTSWEKSDLTGGTVPRYGKDPVDASVPLLRETRAALVVREPAGYIVPQEWVVCRDRMDIHGIRYRRFVQNWSDSVEAERVVEWNNRDLAEGHHETRVTKIAIERRLFTARPGDLWVPMDQPGATLAMHLFEAQAPDGLMRWNFFDTILEKKEYTEDYVMEPYARKMMSENPELARAFRDRLATDPAFARDSTARLDWFYRRSPWADPWQNLVPVLRARHLPPAAALETARP